MVRAGQCSPPYFHSTATTTQGYFGPYGQQMMTVPSPAAAEAGRIQRADAAMLRFCTDLNGLVGRVIVPPEMLDQDGMDPLTAEIYDAAIEAGLDYNAVLAGDSPLDTPTWMRNASRVLAKLRRRVPEATFNRVLDVVTGSEKDVREDPDAKAALDYAEAYFDTGPSDDETLVDLATCLLDYAFTRQGLDDSFVPDEPKPLPPADTRTRKEKLLDGHKRELFVKSVKEALLDWKESLIDQVEKLAPTSIYRIAMVHSNLPTGDELAKQCYAGATAYKNSNSVNPFHPTVLVTIGHAALALEKISHERGVPTDKVAYKLFYEYCRTCGTCLDLKRHGCCRNDLGAQSADLQYLNTLMEIEAHRDYMLHDSFFGSKHDEYISNQGDYLLRRTPTEDGKDRYEIHVKQIWGKGIWQEVPDREAGERLAKRVIAEHRREKALAVVEQPSSTDVTISKETHDTLIQVMQDANGVFETLVAQRKDRVLAAVQAKAHAGLARSIKVFATILCGAGFVLTGKVVFFPLWLVAWLMAFMLVDRKALALKAKAEHKALNPAENPLSQDDDPIVKKS